MKSITPIIVFLLLFAFACEKDPPPAFELDKISGLVQKGPFINGTAITVAELNAKLNPTGKTFSSQIVDNKGSFVVNDLELQTQYIEIRADGFYYDEVRGEKSSTQLTLFGLADISDQQTININILTQLEKGRVEYLMGEGKDFKQAKAQAQSEVLNIFGFERENMSSSEKLDISKEDEENAILLAISLIVQGNGSVGDLTELLANINTDIREDGLLSSTVLDSILITQASTLSSAGIRQNLINRYKLLGVEASLPDFDKYINSFLPGGLNVTYETTTISCNGQADGAIALSITGGTPPYSYAWSGGETSKDISDLSAGTYSVSVTDSRYLSYTVEDINVVEPQALHIIENRLTHSDLDLDNGAVDIKITGGSPPYVFNWSNGAVSEDIYSLTPGSYSLTVTDANNCSDNKSFQVVEQSYVTTDPSCNGDDDGEIDLTVSSGTPPYTFVWSNGETTEDVTGLSAGMYWVYITDAADNIYEIKDIAIYDPFEIKISAEITNIGDGEESGSIDVSIDGGTPPYSYTWSTGASSEDVTDLAFGSYDLEVIDSHGCAATKAMSISSSFTDSRDGQSYAYVIIGEQTWMAENLNYGVRLEGGVASTDNGTIEKYCLDNLESNCDERGGLYFWDEMMQYTLMPSTKGICPDGWHIPSDDEWKILEAFLGMSEEDRDIINQDRGTNEADMLRPPEDCVSGNDCGITGFNARLTGQALLGGSFSFKDVGTWWTSSEGPDWEDDEYAGFRSIERAIFKTEPILQRYSGYRSSGHAVRCIKDE